MQNTEVETSGKKRAPHRMNGDHSIRKQKKEISKIDEAGVEFPTLHETTMAIILRWKCKLDGKAKNFPLIISTENFSDKYRCSPESVKISFIGKVGRLRDKKEIESLADNIKVAEDDFVLLGKAGDKTFASKIISMSNKMEKFVRKDEILEFFLDEQKK